MDLIQGLFYENRTRSFEILFQIFFCFIPIAYFMVKLPIVHILSRFPLFSYSIFDAAHMRSTRIATKVYALLSFGLWYKSI